MPDKELRLDLAHPDWSDDPKRIEAAILESGARPVVVDASTAGGIGTLSAQLLIATRRHAAADKRGFRIDAPSAAVQDALRLMALEDLLFPEVTP